MSRDIDEDLQELDRQIRHIRNPWGDDMNDVLALLEKDYTNPQSARPFPGTTVLPSQQAPAPEPWDAWVDDQQVEWTPEQLQPRPVQPRPVQPVQPAQPAPARTGADRVVGTLIAVAAVQCVAIAALLAIWLL